MCNWRELDGGELSVKKRALHFVSVRKITSLKSCNSDCESFWNESSWSDSCLCFACKIPRLSRLV